MVRVLVSAGRRPLFFFFLEEAYNANFSYLLYPAIICEPGASHSSHCQFKVTLCSSVVKTSKCLCHLIPCGFVLPTSSSFHFLEEVYPFFLNVLIFIYCAEICH